MRKKNCKVGMKVTTVGDTIHLKRANSPSCRRELKDGYITIMRLHDDHLRIGYPGTNGKFKYDQVHPYWSDTNHG